MLETIKGSSDPADQTRLRFLESLEGEDVSSEEVRRAFEDGELKLLWNLSEGKYYLWEDYVLRVHSDGSGTAWYISDVPTIIEDSVEAIRSEPAAWKAVQRIAAEAADMGYYQEDVPFRLQKAQNFVEGYSPDTGNLWSMHTPREWWLAFRRQYYCLERGPSYQYPTFEEWQNIS